MMEQQTYTHSGYVSVLTGRCDWGLTRQQAISQSGLSQIPWQVWKKWCNLHLWLSWPLLASIAMVMVCHDIQQSNCSLIGIIPWENKWSPWTRGELTVTTVVMALGANDHGSVTARLGHSSVTARSQLSHGEVTAQSRLGHSSVMARSQLSHGDHGSIKARSQLNHGSVTAGCDHFGHRELTVSSPWTYSEQSRWPIFFSWDGILSTNLFVYVFDFQF